MLSFLKLMKRFMSGPVVIKEDGNEVVTKLDRQLFQH